MIDSKKMFHAKADLRDADLRKRDMQHVCLNSADMTGAKLRGANLQHADLRASNLRNADLRDADLRCADMYDSKLQVADLSGADLRNVNMQAANLTGTGGVIPLGCPHGWTALAWRFDWRTLIKVGCHDFSFDEAVQYWDGKWHRKEVLATIAYARAMAALRGWPT